MRITILPDVVAEAKKRGMANFAAALKAEFTGPLREDMNRQGYGFWSAVGVPDPWDEAIRWIEEHEAAKREWAFPW